MLGYKFLENQWMLNEWVSVICWWIELCLKSDFDATHSTPQKILNILQIY